MSTTETGLDLRAVWGRYEAWYADREADTPGLDEGESLSEYIVRNDLPELLACVDRLRGQVALKDAALERVVVFGLRCANPFSDGERDREGEAIWEGLRAALAESVEQGAGRG